MIRCITIANGLFPFVVTANTSRSPFDMASELLQMALEAHGGLSRWGCFATVQATIVTGGQLFGMKGTP